MGKSNTTLARPPVVAVLGHVDHGKTSLLDYIRQTHVQVKEAGGITQSIGAYQATFQGSNITFIDTPGHAAFRSMRSRGASVADLAVLVIAADDGVKPQTKESIKYLKESGPPFIVAINKIDKQGVTAETAKAELTQEEVFVEGYGGNTPVVELSAKTGQGVDKLLESIVLMAELEELKNQPTAKLVAPIIEANKDMKKGILVSVIVKQGTLSLGQVVATPTAVGKIRALFSSLKQPLQQAGPGEAVQIMGFKDLPHVGETITNTETTVKLETPANLANTPISEAIENKLNIILKSDSLGSLEAITSSLTKEVNLISSGTGDITDADILLAASTGATILGFAVRAKGSTQKLAETEGVTLKTYSIIYELLEYLEKKVLRLLEPTIDEEELGTAKVLKLFEINKDLIAGCHVESGRLAVGDQIHLKKKNGELKNAKIKSLRTGKQEVKEVKAGEECGLLTFPQLDIAAKDHIIAYKINKTDD